MERGVIGRRGLRVRRHAAQRPSIVGASKRGHSVGHGHECALRRNAYLLGCYEWRPVCWFSARDTIVRYQHQL